VTKKLDPQSEKPPFQLSCLYRNNFIAYVFTRLEEELVHTLHRLATLQITAEHRIRSSTPHTQHIASQNHSAFSSSTHQQHVFVSSSSRTAVAAAAALCLTSSGSGDLAAGAGGAARCRCRCCWPIIPS
jgi:ectoine hydroxylase-related dioxygenase (phytanoyl-CoA dioxygenase family)